MPKVGQITATLKTRCAQGRPIVKFQTRAPETFGQYSPDLRLVFIYIFSFIRPAHSGAHTTKKYRNNCRGNEQIFVFNFFLYFCGPIPVAVGLRLSGW